MKICSTCVLPENFPSLRMDSEGVCNYCRAYRGDLHREEYKARYRHRFEQLVQDKAGRSEYDIIVAYSGGKDSTFTLDLLKRQYGLHIMAFTFDNGFVSQRAFANMQSVTERLGVDHLLFKPDFQMLKKVFRACADSNPYPVKSLERATPICTSCMIFVKAALLKTALEKQIPFLGYGWSPGQAPIHSSVMKMNPSFARSAQSAAFEALKKAVPDLPDSYFLKAGDFEDGERFPYGIHPLAFSEYDEKSIYRRIGELGWTAPDDTDPNSTNCMMNAFAVHVHKEQFKFHPYAFEISGLVRSGVMTRGEGLKRIYASEEERVIGAVRKRLNEVDS